MAGCLKYVDSVQGLLFLERKLMGLFSAVSLKLSIVKETKLIAVITYSPYLFILDLLLLLLLIITTVSVIIVM